MLLINRRQICLHKIVDSCTDAAFPSHSSDRDENFHAMVKSTSYASHRAAASQ